MTYTPERQYQEELEIDTIPPNEWAYLTRTEKQVRLTILLLLFLFYFDNEPVLG